MNFFSVDYAICHIILPKRHPLFTSVYEEVSRVLQMFGMDVQGTFMDIGHHTPGEVRVNTELMEKAKMAGSQLLK